MRLRFAALPLIALACSRTTTPAVTAAPVPAVPVDICADARAQLAAQPDLMVDTPPQPVEMKPALFQKVPTRALRRDGSAELKADVVIDTLGRADMKTLKVLSTSNAWFATDLARVLPHWRFSPAQLGGCKVPRTYHFAGGIRPRAKKG